MSRARRVVAYAAVVGLLGCGRLNFDTQAQEGAGLHSTYVPNAMVSGSAFAPIDGSEFTFTATPDESWLVLVSASLSTSSPLAEQFTVEARYTINGIERGIGGVPSERQGFGSWQHFVLIEGESGPQTVVVELREGTGGTATARDLRVIALRLPESADAHYASADDTASVVSATTLLDLEFVPSSPGEYLMMALSNATELVNAPSSVDARTNWTAPDGTLFAVGINPRKGWMSTLGVLRASLDTGPSTLTLNAEPNNGEVGVRYARALAFRLDAFVGASSEQSATPPSVADVETEIGLLALEAAPAEARRLALATALVRESCPDRNPVRHVQWVADGQPLLAFDHVPGNCALLTSYGGFAILDDDVKAIGLGAKADEPEGLRVLEFGLHALTLP